MSATAWTGKKPAGVEKTVNVLDKLSWTVQPPLGLICGDYFRVENNFAPHHALDRGYHGILEVVEKDGKLLHIEFNEINSPSYYNRYYQNASKRRSDYCFFQATKERTARSLKVLDNGFTAVEQQMLRENRLTGDFDLVTGASNSVKRSLLPLAAQVEALRTQPRTMYYYGYAEKLPGGLTARLQVVFQNGRIVRCFFDEIFADTPEEIDDPALKKYYRQSKYDSITYESPYPDGFNALSDLLQNHVLATQDLLDLTGLPWTKDTDTRKRNVEWDHYLRLAQVIAEAARKDGRLS